MLPTLVDEPPGGDDWIHEIKYDGYRTLLAVDGVNTRAFTRNGHDWTEKYDIVVHHAAALRCDTAIIDGEIAVQDERGVTDFQGLRHPSRAGAPGALRLRSDHAHRRGPAQRTAG